MTSKLSARLARLEQHVGPAVDLAEETARHGRPLWSVPGLRAYGQDADGGARLAFIGASTTLVYEVLDVPLAALS